VQTLDLPLVPPPVCQLGVNVQRATKLAQWRRSA
jgi:hypothetical protein